MLSGLFALTLFLSAALLFLVQPMIGKRILPLLGGTPAVWNTCLFFYQTVLLLGYLHAHWTTSRLGVRRQARWHLLLLGVPPMAFALGYLLRGEPVPLLGELVPSDEDYPVLPLLGVLLAATGPAFYVLATTGPLLQRWIAEIGMTGRSPYVLYAASNAGSLLGLLAYPFVIEPTLTLTAQQHLWAGAVVGCVVLLMVCAGLTAWLTPSAERPATVERTEAPTSGRVARWLGLSALTSVLLNATTTHLTTDMAPMPLLWVVPLALYLISFILVFWRWPTRAQWLAGRILPMLLLFLILALVTRATEPLALIAGLPLLVFFVAALVCHGELALDRPPPDHLTAFYLYLSLGSALGSLFCVLLAPVLFQRLGVVEYPLALVLVALVRPGQATQRPRTWDVVAPLLLGLGTVALVFQVPRWLGPAVPYDSPDHVIDRMWRMGLMFGVPAVAAFALVRQPVRYALSLGALLVAATFYPGPSGSVLYTERNFFGTIRVTESPDGRYHRLVHGTTLHGQQRIGEVAPIPLMYYHATGPAGRVLAKLPAEQRRRVGVVGLGCGALAAYARRGEEWVFYEIDPAVIRIAREQRYFTYLSSCRGELRIVPGDARRQLERETEGQFDLLLLDAFSSDAIPVHLLTREALALYQRMLRPGGVLLFHVSNRYLDLPPLLARLAEDPESGEPGGGDDSPKRGAGLTAFVDYNHPTSTQAEEGKLASTWVLMGGAEAVAPLVARDPYWMRLEATPGPVWTDTFSNLLGVWKRDE